MGILISPADFAKLFKSEADLREKLASLFRKMPRTQGIRITHGAQELGKDIVFLTQDSFGDWQLNACVVKLGEINGQAGSNLGARTVFHQAEQALDSALIGDDGSELFATVVYIISPYDCSIPTMNSIKGQLAQRHGQVKFLCGAKLADLFERHLPELLLFDSSFLGTYVLQLQSRLKQMDPIRFLMQNHDLISSGLQSFESVYVKQNFRKVFTRFEVNPVFTVEPFIAPSMNQEAVRSLRVWLSSFSAFVSDRQIWDDWKNPRIQELENALLKLNALLESEATSKFAQANRERFRSADDTIHATPIEIRLSEDLYKELNETTKEAYAIFHAFTVRIEAVNKWVVGTNFGIRSLTSPDFLSLCRIEEAVKSHPGMFRRSRDQKSWLTTNDLLDKTTTPLLITASAGHGKTSFCKWRVLEDIKNLEERKSNIVPFYVPLHLHATAILANCEETFLQDPNLVNLLHQLHQENRQMRIFLDGLDEVSTMEQQQKLIQQAEELHNRYPSLQVIVTARDHVRGPWLRWLARIDIAEFSAEQSEELSAKWLVRDSAEYIAFHAQLERARTLESLTRVPLLCTLIIAVFKRSNALPATRASLYDVFVELMCGGWDLAKNIRRKLRFGAAQKRNVLTRLAGLLQLNRKREATEQDFRVAIGEVDTAASTEWRSMLDEILEDSLVGRVGENVVFAHLSFQEYLAARDLTDPTGRRQAQALRAYFNGDDWWAEVLAFYLSTSPRADEMAEWVTKEANRSRSKATAQDRGRRRDFLIDSIRSSSEGWIPRNQQLSLGYGREFED